MCVCVCVSLEEQPVPDEVVLKVFKTTLNEFKNRDRYIKDDYRFKERFSKLNPRKIIRLWAEKEMHNLSRYAAPCWSHCWSHHSNWCSAGVDSAGLMEAVLMEVCGFLICFGGFFYRMKKAEIPCPEVVLLKKHILVMSFIGKDHVPAPKLKDVVLSSEDMKRAFYQVLHVRTATQVITHAPRQLPL